MYITCRSPCRCMYQPVIDTITFGSRYPVMYVSYIIDQTSGPMGITSHIVYRLALLVCDAYCALLEKLYLLR
jgi:hypothetical protein